MKKLLSVLLALTFVLSMATVAFAAEGDTASPNGVTSVTFVKNYVDAEGNKTSVVPDETLTFTITSNPSDAPAAYIGEAPSADGKYSVSINANATNITVTLPEYKEVGEYQYTIQEKAGSAQGVTYSTAEYVIKVQVVWNDAHTDLVQNVVVYDANNKKVSDSTQLKFDNTYALGQLDVKKTVTGNLGDKTVGFEMTVTFTSEKAVLSEITITDGNKDGVDTKVPVNAWQFNEETGVYTATANIKVTDSETVNITNIPQGVSYQVEEASKHILQETENFDPNSASDTQYTVSYSADGKGTISATTSEVTVTNNKGTGVDTGITLDSVPYIVLIAVCAVAAVLFVVKRRSVEF